MLTYKNASNLFDFLLLCSHNSEHVVEIIFLFNNHLYVIPRVVVDVVNAFPFVLSTIFIRIIVCCRHLFPAFILGLGRILRLLVAVFCQGKSVGFRRCGNGSPLDWWGYK